MPWRHTRCLVSVQYDRLRRAFQQVYDIRESVDVLVSGTAFVRHFGRQDLLCEHVEVECDLEVVEPDSEGRHIGDYDLSGTVNRFPSRKDEIGIQVSDFSRLKTHAMLGFRLDAQIAVALVRIVVADSHLHIDSDECRRPAVAVSGMFLVDLTHRLDNILTLVVTWRGLVVLPLIVPRPAYAHYLTEVSDGAVLDSRSTISNSSALNEHTPVPHPRSSERHNFFSRSFSMRSFIISRL